MSADNLKIFDTWLFIKTNSIYKSPMALCGLVNKRTQIQNKIGIQIVNTNAALHGLSKVTDLNPDWRLWLPFHTKKENAYGGCKTGMPLAMFL